MQVNVAQSAGFCFGVREAVQAAELILATRQGDEGLCYMLGEIVHNEAVVQNLLQQGFRLAQSPSDCLPHSKVVIRAHGVSAATIGELQAKSCCIIDKTCPFVSKIQRLVAEAVGAGQRIILLGSKNHPEVEGILARSGEEPYLIQNAAEAEIAVFPPGSYLLCSQTTFAVADFKEICRILQKKIAKLDIFDTICGTTLVRQREAAELARESDLVLVLGSSQSSNTQKLFQICTCYCRDTYLIQRPDQILALMGARDLRQLRIGITAGASTPERMIREVIQVMTENEVFNGGVIDKVEEVQVEAVQETATAGTTENTEATACACTEIPAISAEEEVNASELAEPEQHEEPKAFSFSDYIDGIAQLKRGMVVKGSVVRYDDEFVYIDVHDKSEGKVPRNEFLGEDDFDLVQAVEEHREIDVYVRNIKNTDMGKEIVLSKAKVDFTKHKEVIERAFAEKTPIMVKVTNVVKDGVIASYGSVDLYIHRTQLDANIVEDLEAWRGRTIEVMVTQYDPNRKRLRVTASHRTIVAKERKQRARDLWNELEIGKEFDGTVRNITDFGAFVDLGGVDGLVHVTELSWKRIKNPAEVVQVGDKIHVFIKGFDKEKKKISLGYKRPENDPYFNVEQRFPVGSIVRGLVVRMFPFGAFIEVAPGVDALCHISQISNYHLNRPDDVLQEGMEVDARVLEVSDQARKISISIKEVEPIDPENPEALLAQRNENRAPREERSPNKNKRPRKSRQNEDEDGLPTTYVDTPSGTSLSSLADFTVASKEGAEVLKQFGINDEDQGQDAE